MRTTLDIDDQMLMQAKSLAASARTTLTQLIEEGLSLRLRAERCPSANAARINLPVYAGRGGLHSNIRNPFIHQALLDAADDGDFAQ